MNSQSAGYSRFRLFTPNPPDFFLRVFADEKKTSGSACIDASRLIFQSAVCFQIRLVAKKQAGPTRLFFCIPAVKPSEFTERTLSLNKEGPRYAPSACLNLTGPPVRADDQQKFLVLDTPILKHCLGLTSLFSKGNQFAAFKSTSCLQQILYLASDTHTTLFQGVNSLGN